MKKRTYITHIALVALTTLALAMDAQARGGGGMAGGMGGGHGMSQGYGQTSGQGSAKRTQTQAQTQKQTQMQSPSASQQENRVMTQERVRAEDGSGDMAQRQESLMEQRQLNRQQAAPTSTTP